MDKQRFKLVVENEHENGHTKKYYYLLVCKTAEIGPDLQQKQQSLLWFLVSPGSLHLGTKVRSKIPLTVISRLTLWFHFQSLTIWALTWYLTWPVYTVYRLDNNTPSAIDSEAIEPLSVLHSKLKFEW